MSKGEKTRQHIIETAADLFWSRGYNAVSVSDLSRQAGLNKATLYQYFTAKERLAIEVVKHQRKQAIEIIFNQAFNDTDQPEDRLKRVYEITTEVHRSAQNDGAHVRGCPFVNAGMELADANEDVRLEIEETFQQFAKYYRTIVDELRPSDEDPSLKEAAARALVRNMNGAMVASKIEQRPEAVSDAYETALLLARGHP